MAEAVAQARSWKECPYTLGGTVEAIDEDPLNLVRRLLLGCHALKRPIGLGKSRRTGLFRVAQMPEHPATDNRGQVHLLRETATVLLVGQEVDRQWQPASGQHDYHTLVSERTDRR